MELLRNADLTEHNTFRIAAKAEYLGRFRDADQLRSLLNAEEIAGLPRMVLGSGSNVLFTRDYPGAILLNEVPGIDLIREDEQHVWLKAGAGVIWHQFVLHCVARGWGGVENLSLIPGKVGAAPMQNIGAYGVEIKHCFHSLDALRIVDGEQVTFDPTDCAFGYRESFFKRDGRDRFVIMSVTFKLTKAPHVLNSSYGTIQHELDRMGNSDPTIQDISAAIIAIRQSKLPDPALIGNAGSFFKNPVVSKELADSIRSKHPDMVAYSAGTGQEKLAAGWMIEKAGWKGYRANDHGVHERQALVLVNYGGASGEALYELSDKVIGSVRELFGVELEREVNIV